MQPGLVICEHLLCVYFTRNFQLDVLLNQNVVPELATLVHTSKAEEEARVRAIKLRDNIPRRQFLVSIRITITSYVKTLVLPTTF